MTEAQLADLPEAQRKAVEDLFRRSGYTRKEMFERLSPPTPLDAYVGVSDFHGMFVGIEPDGYTHT